ncbi:MAG: hypothetical protein AAGE05_11335 [Pseudomonadota bacterium]
MARFTDYVLGERPHPGTLVSALLAGFAMAMAVAMRAEQWDWQTILLMLLAADIGAGLVSNATEATRARWRARTSAGARIGFIAVHLIAYPTVLFILAQGDLALFAFLATVLAAKIIAFAAGKYDRPV